MSKNFSCWRDILFLEQQPCLFIHTPRAIIGCFGVMQLRAAAGTRGRRAVPTAGVVLHPFLDRDLHFPTSNFSTWHVPGPLWHLVMYATASVFIPTRPEGHISALALDSKPGLWVHLGPKRCFQTPSRLCTRPIDPRGVVGCARHPRGPAGPRFHSEPHRPDWRFIPQY